MKLEYYGGNGYDGVKERAEFIVKVGTMEYEFKSLILAREFYNSIKHIEKSLWLTTGTPELLECHTVQ